MSPDFNSAFTPFKLNTLQLRNRFIKTATFEGMCRNGLPTQQLMDFHARLAQGGVGLTTVAYGAVNADGRTHEDQMYMRKEVLPGLKKLTDAVHAHGGAASIQLTHCGFFSRNRKIAGRKPLGPSRTFNSYGLMSGIPFSRSMTPDDLRHTAMDFANAAALAQKAGFDAVEIHAGHGYLLSQFLSPNINRRKDEYGGSLENRLRFPLEVVEAVRKAVGEYFPILCKINLSDDFKGGLVIREAVEVAKSLEKAGVDALVMSGGYTSRTPFFLMPGKVPFKGMIKVEKNRAQKAAIAIFGPLVMKKYSFKENFFLPLAKEIREAVDIPLVYLGGVVSRQGIEQVMEEGFELVAIGRALIHDPDFVLNLKEEKVEVSACNHCNECVVEMDRGGVRCVL